MTEPELREFCRRMLDRLAITPPIDPEQLCRRLSDERGRPIVLEARTLPGAEGFGFGSLLPMRTKDVLVYPTDVSRPWQAWIIFHEVIHIVRGHIDDDAAPLLCGSAAEQALEATDPGTAAYYVRWQEWEAETGATILAGLSSRPSRAVRADRDDLTDVERAYARAIGGDID